MPSLKSYRQQMFTLQDDPDGFGRYENIATLPAGGLTATVASLAVGTRSNAVYQNKWLCRPDAALVGGVAVDRVRMCSAYTSSSGTLTHAGTAWVDLTVGTEQIEVSEYEPSRLDASINRALARLRFRDVEVIPTVGTRRYWLNQLTWLNEPSDVDMVLYRPNPVLSRNRSMQKWNIATPGTAAATAVPDYFTLTGAAATSARVTANTWRSGQYACEVVAGGGAVAVMTQNVGLLDSGVGANDLQGKIVTVIVIGRATAASQLRGWVSDNGGTTKQYTAYHAGTSRQAELTLQYTLSATASNVAFGWEQAAAATAQVSECYLVLNAISDGVRNDSYRAIEIEKVWDQSAGPSALVLEVPQVYGLGGQIEVHSKRSYPTLTLDTDTADAPLTDIAADALFLLYRGLASTPGQDNTRYASLASYWNSRASTLRATHYYTQFGQYGAPWPPRLLAPFPVRV